MESPKHRTSGARNTGKKRLRDLVHSKISLSPLDLQDQLLANVKNFAGEVPIRDDLTLLLVRAVDV